MGSPLVEPLALEQRTLRSCVQEMRDLMERVRTDLARFEEVGEYVRVYGGEPWAGLERLSHETHYAAASLFEAQADNSLSAAGAEGVVEDLDDVLEVLAVAEKPRDESKAERLAPSSFEMTRRAESLERLCPVSPSDPTGEAK